MTKSQVSKHPYLTGSALIKVFEEADITIQNMSKGVLTYYGFAKVYRVQPQIALYKLPKDIIPNPNRISFEKRYPVDFWYNQLGIPEHTELPEYMQVSKRSPAKRQLIKEYTNEN